jgi:cell division protease FtsH
VFSRRYRWLGTVSSSPTQATALLRAGRFDRQILVDRPDKKGRIDILNVHLKKIKLASDVPVENIAALTPGFSGADLANLVNEAALLATRQAGDSVTLDHFNQAIERIIAGLEKRNRLLNPHEREVVAYHEMGHALLAMALPGVDPVQKISIIPRGIAGLGYTVLSSPSCWLRWWLGSCWLGPWRMGSRWKAAPWMGHHHW